MLKQTVLNRFTIYRLSLVLIGVVLTSLFYVPAASANTEITDCTETNLRLAIAAGQVVTFNCSGSSTITLGSEIDILTQVTIDGGGTVTINGGGNRIFNVGIGRKLTLQNITITGGSASQGSAIYNNNNGQVWLVNSTIIDNDTVASSICTTGIGGNKSNGCGAIFNTSGATLNVISSTISNNDAPGRGGAISNVDATVNIIGSVIEGNTATSRGGAINHFSDSGGGQLTIENSIIRNNTSSHNGGAIFIHSSPATILNSTLDTNTAVNGGGMAILSDNSSVEITINRSTFSNNKVSDLNSTNTGGLEIAVGDDASKTVQVNIENSTFFGNQGGNPGAIRTNDTAQVTIKNVTIAQNSVISSNFVGGIQAGGTSTVSLQNSILYANSSKHCNTQGSSTLTNNGGNVRDNNDTCLQIDSSVPDKNPGLDSLNDNGGWNLTAALVVIDSVTGSSCPTIDQRGWTRPNAPGSCDAGAYERNATVPLTSTVTSATTSTLSGEPAYKLAVGGTNFNQNSIVYWNDKPLPTVYNSDTSLTAYVSIADYKNLPGSVTVGNGTGDTSASPYQFGPNNPPTSVTISGPTSGLINNGSFSFITTVEPTTTTLPLTYTWSGTYLSATPHIAMESLNDSFTVDLDTAGDQIITVTVENNEGTTVTATHNVEVVVKPDANNITTTQSLTTAEILDNVEFEVSIPTTTTTPITYIWEATEQEPTSPQTTSTKGAILNHNYTWVTSGTKYITLTIQNVGGETKKYFSITITIGAINVGVSGPDKGGINTDYTFTATVFPVTPTRTITYQWQANDISGITTQQGMFVTTTIPYSWTTGGTKVVTVTASDTTGQKTVSTTITIDTPPLSVMLTGAKHGELGQAYTFTATSDPSTTTPITYLWEVDGQTAITQTTQSGIYTDTASWTWDSIGTKMITVTAQNRSGSIVAKHTIEIVISPAGLMLSGPTVGRAGNSYNFKAIVSPTTTTRPLTYTWQADGLETKVLTSTSLTSPMSLTWMDAGTKTITVTAQSPVNSQSKPYQFLVLDMDATGIITLDGTTDGTTDQTQTFTATLNSDAATDPVTYTWTATDKDAPVVLTGTLTSTQPFTWDSPGIKVVTLTAESPWSTEVTTREIIMSDPIYPPVSIMVAGIKQGNVDNSYQFEATVSPTTTTTPLTYTWQATDFPTTQIRLVNKARTIQTNTLTDTITYTWAISGEKVITVTAHNASGMVTATYSVMVYVPPLSATINGPITGFINTEYTFTTTIMPISATLPITYVWSPEPMGGEGAVISYTWDTTGTRTIILTTTNVGGWITTSHTIDISINDINDKLPAIYLPIVVKLK
ncbi:choice-of-anchor Q domain-containing protein [Anaerolineales bacterium HSG25]|nr:choice-of-anchor Q domain-containing protein [Anaerolineales bacterium HSG25]